MLKVSDRLHIVAICSTLFHRHERLPTVCKDLSRLVDCSTDIPSGVHSGILRLTGRQMRLTSIRLTWNRRYVATNPIGIRSLFARLDGCHHALRMRIRRRAIFIHVVVNFDSGEAGSGYALNVSRTRSP
jgi:hypothetical protein